MKSDTCFNCRTYFDENEKAPPESMIIEFKNYYLPLKENKPKWIILKTITGFLNSKGGTIYIGVEDQEGKVLGQEISRKEQDEFMLFIKTLVERIKPAVDLVNKEEIIIKYIPVVTAKVFKGKYVIKIIVKQGDPTKTYHFTQKIQLQYKGKIEEFQNFHAFYRHNMGGIVEMNGEALLEEIGRKSAHPNEVANTFHKFCNPEPLKLEKECTKIGFSGVRREQLRKKLEEIFHKKMQQFEVDYELTYDIENQVLLAEFDSVEQFKEINEYVKNNLSDLNHSNESFKFIEKGVYLDFYLYKNSAGSKEVHPNLYAQLHEEQKAQLQPQTQIKSSTNQPQPAIQKDPQFQIIQASFQEQDQSKPQLDDDKTGQTKLNRKYKDKEKEDKAQKLEECNKLLEKQFVLTVTHVNVDLKDELIKYLQDNIVEKAEMNLTAHEHTIELTFATRQSLISYNNLLQKNHLQKLARFGVNGNLVTGINLNNIRITNYDRNKRKQIKLYIQELIGQDIEELEFKKSNNKYFLDCKVKTRTLACFWLDRLLANKDIKNFSIPGSELGKAAKMKIFIECYVN